MAEQYYTCYTCKNQFVSKVKGKKFCSMNCYRAFQKTDEYKHNHSVLRIKNWTECTHCKKQIVRKLSIKRNGEEADNAFCNRQCYDEYRNFVKQQVTGQCKNCGKNLILGTHRKALFCCMDCKKEYKRPKSKYCTTCGVWFSAIKIHKNKDGSHRISGYTNGLTCSDECLREFYRINEERKDKISQAFIGNKHPNWQGGSHRLSSRGSGWQRLRRAVIKRDGYKCRHCGIDQQKQFELYNRDFSVNHIIPFHQYGNTVKANQMNNLETLCDSCHTKADWAYRKNNPIQMVLNFDNC